MKNYLDAIYLLSIEGRFRYKFKQNSPQRTTSVCNVDVGTCPWKVTAHAIGQHDWSRFLHSKMRIPYNFWDTCGMYQTHLSIHGACSHTSTPGRPRKHRIESQFMSRRTIHCSRCNQAGHNRATCNNPFMHEVNL